MNSSTLRVCQDLIPAVGPTVWPTINDAYAHASRENLAYNSEPLVSHPFIQVSMEKKQFY